MHRLLARQLAQIDVDKWCDITDWQLFLSLINDAYQSFDANQKVLQRSLDLSSEELSERNHSLNNLLKAFPDSNATFNQKNLLCDIRLGIGLERFEGADFRRLPVSELPFIKKAEEFANALNAVRESGEVSSLEYLLQNGTEEQYIEARIAPLDERNILVIFRDITERKIVSKIREEQLLDSQKSRHQLQQLINAAPIGIMLCNVRNEIMMLNRFAQQHLGFCKKTLLGTSVLSILHPDSHSDYQTNLHTLVSESSRGIDRGVRFDVEVIPPKREPFSAELGMAWTEINATPWIALIFADITERKELELELRKLASTDPLTGCENRRHFLAQAKNSLAVSERKQHPIAILLLDIDHFKKINDTYGHSAGDSVLISFVKNIKTMLRASDHLGRLGGEEFAIVLSETDQSSAMVTAERIRKSIEEMLVDTGSPVPLQCTVSIGVTNTTGRSHSIESLLEAADKALYIAKGQGRNQVHHFQCGEQDTPADFFPV